MVKKIIRKIISIIEKFYSWKIILLPSNKNMPLTATKSKFGFWYCGNILDSSDIAYGIFRNGLVEKSETELIINILNHLTTKSETINFYDVGANSGYYGVLASHLGKGKINSFFFEPLNEYTEMIKETVKMNELGANTKIFDIALGSEKKTGIINISGSGSSLVSEFLGDTKNLPKRDISIDLLDEFITEKALLKPDFIKIDVEGFEYEVLQGAKETLTKSKPILFIEIADSLKRHNKTFINDKSKVIFDLLGSLGYNAFVVRESAIEATDTVIKDEGVYMYLFLNKYNPSHTSFNPIK